VCLQPDCADDGEHHERQQPAYVGRRQITEGRIVRLFGGDARLLPLDRWRA